MMIPKGLDEVMISQSKKSMNVYKVLETEKCCYETSNGCITVLWLEASYIYIYCIYLARVHGEGFHSSKRILSRTVVLPRCKLQMIPGVQIDHLEVLGLSHHL